MTEVLGSRSHARGLLDEHLYSAFAALTLALLILLPRTVAAMTGVIAAAVFVVLAVLIREPMPVGPRTRALVVAVGAVASWVGLRSAFTASPAVAWLGVQGQRSGAITWFLLAVVLWVVASRGRRGDLERIARAVAALGAVLALSAVGERAGIAGFVGQVHDNASGLLDNSISVAQVLLIALGCSGLNAFRSKSVRARVTWWAVSSVILLGLWASQTNAVVASIVIVVAFLAVVRLLWGRLRLTSGHLAWAVVSIVVITLVPVWALGVSAPRSDVVAKADRVLNGRVTIWAGAVSRIEQSPLLGQGPGLFNEVNEWTADPGSGVVFRTTYDPHNVLLYWLLAGGIPALLLVLAAVWWASERMAAAAIASRWDFAVMFLVACVAAQALMLLSSWQSPLASLLCVLVVGCMSVQLESANHTAAQPLRSRTTAQIAEQVLVVSVAVGLLGMSTASFTAEYSWARADSGRRLSAEQLGALYRQSGDPAYLTQAAGVYRGMVRGASDIDLVRTAQRELAAPLRAAGGYSANAATEHVLLRYSAAVLGAGPAWGDVKNDIDRAKGDHPSTGMWDYMGAVFARSLGTQSEAGEYAESALEYPLPEATRKWCEQLVAESKGHRSGEEEQ